METGTAVNGTGVGVLYIGNGAAFYNGTTPGSSALFDIQNNDSILYFAGSSSVFSNTGTVLKSGGAATTTLGSGNLAFNNGGAVNILTGTLSLDGGNSTNLGSSGAFTVTSVANLRFNGGNTSLQPSSRVVGAGNVEF